MRNGGIFYYFKRKEEKKILNNVFGVGIRHFVTFYISFFGAKGRQKYALELYI